MSMVIAVGEQKKALFSIAAHFLKFIIIWVQAETNSASAISVQVSDILTFNMLNNCNKGQVCRVLTAPETAPAVKLIEMLA